MEPLVQDPDPGQPARLNLEAERVCDRLRSMSLVRLGLPAGVGGTRADRARILAQELVDSAVALAGRPVRTLPALPDSGVADMLAVCAHDLSAELRLRPGAEAEQACRRAVDALVALRLAL